MGAAWLCSQIPGSGLHQTLERVLFPLGPLEDLEKIGFQSLTPEQRHGFHFKQEFPQSRRSLSREDITHLTCCPGRSNAPRTPGGPVWGPGPTDFFTDSSFFPEWTQLCVLCGNCLLTKHSDHCQMWAPGQLLHNSGFSLLKMVQFKGGLEIDVF